MGREDGTGDVEIGVFGLGEGEEGADFAVELVGCFGGGVEEGHGFVEFFGEGRGASLGGREGCGAL